MKWRTYLGAEARNDDHGRVQRVLVDERAGVADERQHALQSAGFEHGAGLARANQLQHLSGPPT